jgi:arylsulfatase A-like enzyme
MTCVAAALFLACGPAPRPPNIVLISIDSLRPDHLGAYGYRRPTSPNIDRIAGEGLLFENAYSVTSWTLPSHLTMLSGLYPEEHAIVDDGLRLSPRVELLPELLARRGYRSAAVISGPYLNSRFGYAQGWESYDDSLAPADKIQLRSREAASLVSSEAVHDRAVQLLDSLRGGPFFLFLHYFDVHYDYLPPPPFATAFDPAYSGPIDGRLVETGLLAATDWSPPDLAHLVALYDGEIAWVDHWIGEFDRELRERGLDRSTLLVVTADHGEEFFEHGRLGHRQNLYDTTLQVPLVVRLPDRRFAGARVAAPASLVDLAPTIARAARAEPRSTLRGRDLVRTRFGRLVEPSKRDLFASHERQFVAVLRDQWKLIARLTAEGEIDLSQPSHLVDRARDAAEKRNFFFDDPRHSAGFVIAWRRAAEDFARVRAKHPAAELGVSPELEEQLRALGYL